MGRKEDHTLCVKHFVYPPYLIAGRLFVRRSFHTDTRPNRCLSTQPRVEMPDAWGGQCPMKSSLTQCSLTENSVGIATKKIPTDGAVMPYRHAMLKPTVTEVDTFPAIIRITMPLEMTEEKVSAEVRPLKPEIT
ncbi:hypothetical protein BaRGS_00012223 [Batillaria attramentaria]|uniref:Uncharacterized protein n=1 Tax=Batillaria attramentaria TaxID=370345 RepID=A0ABD0LAH9_9CAEN